MIAKLRILLPLGLGIILSACGGGGGGGEAPVNPAASGGELRLSGLAYAREAVGSTSPSQLDTPTFTAEAWVRPLLDGQTGWNGVFSGSLAFTQGGQTYNDFIRLTLSNSSGTLSGTFTTASGADGTLSGQISGNSAGFTGSYSFGGQCTGTITNGSAQLSGNDTLFGFSISGSDCDGAFSGSATLSREGGRPSSGSMFVLSDSAYSLSIGSSSDPTVPNNGLGVSVIVPGAVSGDVGVMTAFRDINANQWNHIAGMYDAATNTCRLAINGVVTSQANCISGSGSPFTANDRLFGVGIAHAGDSNGNNPGLSSQFRGQIDEVRISDTTRYPSNFVPIGGDFGADGSTLGLWHFSEPTGARQFADSAASHTLTGLNGAATGTGTRP